MKRLVLVGGGHAHVEVLRQAGLSSRSEVEITLISAYGYTAYSGMVPGLVAGHFDWPACHIDLSVLSRFARAHFVQDIAVGLDLERRLVRCAGVAEVPYDIVSVDVGSVQNIPPVRQSAHQDLPVRPVEGFLAAWDGVIAEAEARDLSIAVVGAGAGGIELCLSMQYRLQQSVPQHPGRFTLVTLTDEILPDHGAGVRRRFERMLHARSVTVMTRSRVVGVNDPDLLLDGGDRVSADRVVWATGPAPPGWLADSGLNTDTAGFVLVDDCLRSTSHPEVFAVGDIATMANHPRPKSGVYAVRQGPPLAENLHRAVNNHPLRAFKPQSIALQLISTGNRYAVASWGGLAAEGAWVWRWKDSIDRSFMRRYAVQ